MDTSDGRFFSDLSEHQNYFDASVSTEDGASFRIHRVLLSTKSAFFRSLFLSRIEGDSDVTVKGIDGHAMRNVISFIYSGKLQLDSVSLVDTLVAARQLQVEDLEKHCQARLSKQESVQNCSQPLQVPPSPIIQSHKPASVTFLATCISNHEGTTLELYQFYDQQIGVWAKIGEASWGVVRKHNFLLRLDESIFVFDLHRGRCLGFNFLEHRWLEMRPLSERYRHYCVVETNHRIYALGSEKQIEVRRNVPFVEYYDQASDEWCRVSPFDNMQIITALYFKGRIYAFGSTSYSSGGMAVNVQVYSPDFDVWTPIEHPELTKRGFTAVATCSTLWVVQEQKVFTLASVEEDSIFFPDWTARPDLPLSYRKPRAADVCGRVYVFDARDQDSSVRVNNPVCWDSESESWKTVPASSPMYHVGRYLFCEVYDRDTVEAISAAHRDGRCRWEMSPFASV